MTPVPPAPPAKPLLRGTSHFWAFLAALPAGLMLVLFAHSGARAGAAAIYAASLAMMFGFSALYHRPDWPPVARLWLRRLDHAGIYLVIAGSYTPICMLAIGGPTGALLLRLVWLGAGLGILKCLLWVDAPRALGAALYVALGCTSLFFLPQTLAGLGAGGFAVIAAGGLVYLAGAFIYALRRPDPLPLVFGYHEVFHILVIVAALCHFVVISRVVVGA